MLDSSRFLLDTVYSQLGFEDGDLLTAQSEPQNSTSDFWVDKGDWLSLAKKIGADRIFFVDNNPVVVFVEQTSQDHEEWVGHFNAAWCMARPQVLFLARDGELSVFDLARPPARQGEEPNKHSRLLEVVSATADVQDVLFRYRREQVESGRLFEDQRFGMDDRADRALVRDLEQVRTSLIEAGLATSIVHALIARSIFIRYLEDRGVFPQDYYQFIAKRDPKNWEKLVDESALQSTNTGRNQSISYSIILSSKALTYALFKRLATDFGGDLFPIEQVEESTVTEQHLKILQRFLRGANDDQGFFFAYRFDIIPVELISSIYECFYSRSAKASRNQGGYYTPLALVDSLLSDSMTDEILSKNPRILDPSCGSGVFLVEAFRRIVRYREGQSRRALTSAELQKILRDQIAGIDINAEAIRVTALSLYLTMLHYLSDEDIRQYKKLPHLTYVRQKNGSPAQSFDILISGDAFRIEEAILDKNVRARFMSNCADVVVGNPPWGAPQQNGHRNLEGGIDWCAQRNLMVGDKERSQAFIYRTLDLLKTNGRAALLVSTGVFFKRHEKTRAFRKYWLCNVTLRKVVNFAAVRHAYFSKHTASGTSRVQKSVAPFASIVFDNIPLNKEHRFAYWSAKETAFTNNIQAVVLNSADLRIEYQQRFINDDTLWKIYWWGGHRDEALISRLRLESSFKEVVDPTGTEMRVGFQEASRKELSKWLKKFREFPTREFERYGAIPKEKLVAPPTRVHRRRERNIYEGPRILIKRGIDKEGAYRGRIIARFEELSFCFRDSIHCAPAGDIGIENAKVILGILWSSLVQYYLFLTSGTWGLWHDEVKKDVIYTIPVRFPDSQKLRKRIVSLVDKLRSISVESSSQATSIESKKHGAKFQRQIMKTERKLDDAINDLFNLNSDERERISDLCNIDLDLFYNGIESDASRNLDLPNKCNSIGRRSDLIHSPEAASDLRDYLETFLDVWEPHLKDQNARFRWRAICPHSNSSIIAVIFEVEEQTSPLASPTNTDKETWLELLKRLEASNRQSTKARGVYIEGLIRIMSDSDIVILKRNERRLWTRSAARDDAEATMVMAIHGIGS